jgi:hypothetical protein
LLQKPTKEEKWEKIFLSHRIWDIDSIDARLSKKGLNLKKVWRETNPLNIRRHPYLHPFLPAGNMQMDFRTDVCTENTDVRGGWFTPTLKNTILLQLFLGFSLMSLLVK